MTRRADLSEDRSLDMDLLVEEARWDSLGLAALAHGALQATFAHMSLPVADIEISVLACDDARIAVLNGQFREKPQPTNVLSWPAEDLGVLKDGDVPRLPQAGPDGCLALGDIALAYETCEREASDAGKPMADHVTHLIVHGALHLLGFDHTRDADALLMQKTEREILGKLGLDDPYKDYEAD